MAILDIVLLLCFIPAIVLGLTKGFIKQAAELIALVLGCWAAFHFTNALSEKFAEFLTIDSKLLNILCFILILAIVASILTLVAEALTKLFKAISLGWVNRLLGLLFSLIKTAFIMGLVIMLFEGLNSSIHLVKESATRDAVVYNRIKEFAQGACPPLKALITNQEHV